MTAATAILPDRMTGPRITAGIFALGYAVNGLVMLADPIGWYEATPNVALTGLPNAHFIRDIGVVFLTLAVTSAIAFVRPRLGTLSLTIGAIWPIGHSLVHVWDFAACRTPLTAWREDTLLVIGPSVLALLLVFWFAAKHGETA